MMIYNKKIDWPITLILSLAHIVGLAGTAVYVYFNGIHPVEIVMFAVLYIFTGLSITAGYHRLYSHRSYESHFLVRLFYMIFGACAIENSVRQWASDHRMHHKFVDTEQDPYNIKQGGWYAHMGWVFTYKSQWGNLDNVKDLEKDPLVMWQDKYYLWIGLGVGALVPALIGWIVGRPWGGFLWGGLFRMMFVHHATFFINSLAHMVGKQTYSNLDTSRDSWWLAFFTYGEGYHNFHHTFQADYRNGVRWYHWDPTKWMIALCARFNLASRLNRTPDSKIFNAKVQMELLNVRKKAHSVSHDIWEKMHAQLEPYRIQMEQAHAKWSAVKIHYAEMKISRMRQSQKLLLLWKYKLIARERRFELARKNWQATLQSVRMNLKPAQDFPISNS